MRLLPPGMERACVFKKRVLLGLAIIVGGVCASLPFRRISPQTTAAVPNTAASSESKSSPLVEPSPATVANTAKVEPEQYPSRPPLVPSPYLDDGSQEKQAQTSPLVTSAEEVSAVPQEKPVTPPMLPVSFQVKEDTNHQGALWQPARLEEGPASPPREYRIRKQDTLEDLAERFLGSKERASEIYEANRHVLEDPQILPLGAVIRIPAAGTATSASPAGDLLPVRPLPEK